MRYLNGEDLAKWVWGFNGDKTNYWALGDRVVSDFFRQCGLSEPEIIFNANIPLYKGEMSRAIWMARRL